MAELGACPTCRKDISANARVCPSCGERRLREIVRTTACCSECNRDCKFTKQKKTIWMRIFGGHECSACVRSTGVAEFWELRNFATGETVRIPYFDPGDDPIDPYKIDF